MRLSLRNMLLGAGLAGLGGAIGYYVGGHRKVNRDVPDYYRHWSVQAKRHIRRDLPPLNYVALGDSAAQGVGASSAWRGYVALIGHLMSEATGREVIVTNLSVSGAVSGDVVKDQLPKLAALEFEPDLVTLDIGGNDAVFFMGNTTESFKASFDAILAALPEGSFVADVPWLMWPGLAQRSSGMAVASRELIESRGHHLVPIHQSSRETGLFGYHRHTAGDLFHPNDRGHAAWAQKFWEQIVETGTLNQWLSVPGR
ncbi:SGNH/GDSL hydrolase family protein [Tessaracoccus caeni]|uniref:SGNH/GDSL hydrolase family protein n=1 Tax=Tessaracoccus caeni TaxID=3031239 RepID=UPI0023DC6D9B|nr:SGNH/GDSL hydrolase family protein [Tessaracoccus caeni]MDF1487383.1 SGNH/GDSL hydrolase family protein [Tessaracoccus caeni]